MTVDDIDADVAALRRVLLFYADASRYEHDARVMETGYSILQDHGIRARDALTYTNRGASILFNLKRAQETVDHQRKKLAEMYQKLDDVTVRERLLRLEVQRLKRERDKADAYIEGCLV